MGNLNRQYNKISSVLNGVLGKYGNEESIPDYLRQEYNNQKFKLYLISRIIGGKNMLRYNMESLQIELMYDQAERKFLVLNKGLNDEYLSKQLMKFAKDADFFNKEKKNPENVMEKFGNLLNAMRG